MKEKSYENFSFANSEGSPKDILKGAADEEKQIHEPEGDTNVHDETTSLSVRSPKPVDAETTEMKPVQCEQSVLEETAAEKPLAASDVLVEPHAEGEDGWQPVQRPRSAGLYGRRIRHRRATVGKVYGYQKKDVIFESDYARLKSNHQNTRYYLLKKRTVSPGSYTDYHAVKNPSPSTKVGRRIVKAVTYRVKSVPSSTKDAAPETSKNGGEVFESPLEHGPVSAPKEVGQISQKSSIVGLGKSPSYKEVALAPPGTISMLQVRESQNDNPDSKDSGVENRGLETNEAKENAEMIAKGENTEEEKFVLNSKDDSIDGVEVIDKEEETTSNNMIRDEHSKIESSRVEVVNSSCEEVVQVVQESIHTDDMPNSMDAPKVELCENGASSISKSDDNPISILQVVEDVKERSSVSSSGDTQEFPNKKLSASAAPFNPSSSVARATPVPMNITLPSVSGAVPAVGHWPLNMTLHPGPSAVLPTVNPMCSSPHHPYPSPPPTPNMIHTVPFLYPSYTQPQAVPTTTFPMTSSPFHPNHFAWQCNMNPNEYMTSTVWPNCHRMEFSVSPTVVEPIAGPILESKEQFDSSKSLSLEANLPIEITNVDEVKKGLNIPASEGVENANDGTRIRSENEKENGDSNPQGVPSSGSQLNRTLNENCGSTYGNQVSRHPWQSDSEKTLNILIRGKRNRKQTLRMPISLLKRPYSSQSFKVVYTRVVRESEALKSSSFSSNENNTASAK